jgi:hypothetical protein
MWNVAHRLVLKPPSVVAETGVEAVLPPQCTASSATPTTDTYGHPHMSQKCLFFMF